MDDLSQTYQRPGLERSASATRLDASASEPEQILPIIIWAVDAAVIILDGVTFSRARGGSRRRVAGSGPSLMIRGPAIA